jgi:hypothetical protein
MNPQYILQQQMCKIDKEMMSGITNNSNLEREREERREKRENVFQADVCRGG